MNTMHSSIQQFYHFHIPRATYMIVIHQQVSCLQIPMDDVFLMQIIHSPANIQCTRQQHWELKDVMMLVQKVIEASSRHVLCKIKNFSITNQA